eukprot:8090781-Karenia_brevis.AAC.1
MSHRRAQCFLELNMDAHAWGFDTGSKVTVASLVDIDRKLTGLGKGCFIQSAWRIQRGERLLSPAREVRMTANPPAM